MELPTIEIDTIDALLNDFVIWWIAFGMLMLSDLVCAEKPTVVEREWPIVLILGLVVYYEWVLALPLPGAVLLP